MEIRKPDTGKILNRLKDFQLATVEYVFDRLYGNDRVSRFLIADEVGLGKTLIAKGIVAKAVDHLWEDSRRRIDIIYICANRDIAAQNIARLNVTEQDDIALASRLTLLPIFSKKMDERLNFISFTPGTSFDLRSKGGIMKERALIYRMLREGWGFGNIAAPKNLLQGDASKGSWDWWIKEIFDDEDYKLNSDLVQRFLSEIDRENIKSSFQELSEKFSRYKKYVPQEDRRDRNTLIGNLRRLLSRSCLTALEPDLIILDEFQRFKNLLEDQDEIAQLAQALFNYKDAKVLLLSATPYKMYTMTHETEQDDHYQDFLRTINFLFGDNRLTKEFEEDLEKYRQALYEVSTFGAEHLQSAKGIIEKKLRRVMVRTERLGITVDRDGMVAEMPLPQCSLKPQDLRAFQLTDQIAASLDVSDTVEYWKSAPYLLNLMDKTSYVLKKKFAEKVSEGRLPVKTLRLFEEAQEALLPWDAIKKYKKIDPLNAKLRALIDNTVGKKAWQLLWIPPSFPYYVSPESPIETNNLQSYTKVIVFSSWQIVPKVIATLCSYEAERSVMDALKEPLPYQELTRRRRPLIVFTQSEGDLKGMQFFSLIYPCLTLAEKIDPLKIAFELYTNGELPGIDKVMAVVKEIISELIENAIPGLNQKILDASGGGQRSDLSWYVAALALLDRHYYETTISEWRSFEEDPDNEQKWSTMLAGRQEETESRFSDHIKLFWDYYDRNQSKQLGSPPSDLIDVLAKIAIASPAVVSLRSLLRLATPKERELQGSILIASAAKIALGFRSLFNIPDSIIVIKSLSKAEDERYWEEVLEYCLKGNLQSVVDEYVHVLKESLGQVDKPIEVSAKAISEEIATAVSLRTVNLGYDDIKVEDNKVNLTQQRLRCRFALRFGNEEGEEGEEETRADEVRKAFNSPFRPFILASTSVGQEGLDFHQYCHSIYHWNLPTNPVDLEQREGRIHRYKGHVIRKNIARSNTMNQLGERYNILDDPWEILFSMAKEARPLSQNDLVPFWIFETEDGFKIQRFVPSLPLSRECDHLERLKKTLAIYRMVFGQPRQEDLIAYLRSRLERDLSQEELLMYSIDLSPQKTN